MIPIEQEPFIGMWRDREDMSDSTGWVRQVRAGYAAYEEAGRDPDYAAEMTEVDAEFDLAVGDGLDDE
ncbi:hypothetical protein [Longimicrobium sp.]|jgi:hypothetical protein|uniref:hypothetical protein n=1 Tax=Longimicrobium sp. TaxID=2029185 RepID=UPI002EDA763F